MATVWSASTPPVETFDLVVFVTAAERGSFAATAAHLQLSTASVSVRLASLERRLGTKLFDRSSRGSTLTASGRRLLIHSKRMLQLMEEAVEQVTTNDQERLVVSSSASLAPIVFPLLLRSLNRQGVDVHCKVLHSNEILREMQDGLVHVGFIFATSPSADVKTVRIGRVPVVAVCLPSHPLAGERQTSLSALAASALSIYRWGPGTDTLVERIVFERGSAWQPINTIGSPRVAVEMARTQNHVALVPRYAVRAELASGELIQLSAALGDWSLEVRLAYARRVSPPDQLVRVLEHIDEFRVAVCS